MFNTISDYLVLLLILAPANDQSHVAKTHIAKHRQWLLLHSKYFDMTRMSLQRLDSLLLAVDNGNLS